MPECKGCGGFVTRDFIRVFGTNEREVFACPECVGFSGLDRGEAANPDEQ